ncbi:MAG: polysaccharide pyruvyl transferase family protein [Patescibacteria group bacterium]
MKKIKRITLVHGINYWNIGDLGITDAMITVFKNQLPESKITVLTPYYNWPKPANILFEQTIKEQPDIFLFPSKKQLKTLTGKIGYFFPAFFNLFFLAIFAITYNISGLKLFFLFSQTVQKTIREYLETDLVISKGGGFLFDHGRFLLSPHAFPIIFAIFLKKPVIIYAQSLGPFKRKLSANIYRYLFKKVTLIIVREKLSQQILSQLRIESILGYDAAFTLETTKKIQLIAPIVKEIGKLKTNNKFIVGLSLLVWKFPKIDSTEVKKYQQKYYQAVSDTINYLQSKYSCYFYFFPHSLESLEIDDMIAIKDVIQKSKLKNNYQIIDTNYNPRFYVELYRQMDFCIGSRMHSNIFTLISGTPLIAISYLPKTEGIMDLLGFKKWVIDIDKISSVALIDKTKALIDNLIPYRKEIKVAVSKAKEESQKNVIKIIEKVEAD